MRGETLVSIPSPFRPKLAVSRATALPALLAACLLLAAGTAAATTYKWTDANGRVVYSDQPPPTSIKSETVLAPPPPPSNPAAVKDLTKQEGEFKKRQMEAVDNAKKAETLRADNVKRNEMCTRAQAQIRTLSAEQVQLVRQNAKGEDVYVDNTTRRKERSELEVWIKANCLAS